MARDPDGPGLLYEAAGTDPDAVAARLKAGLETGRDLREWAFEETGRRTVTAEATGDAHTTAVVLAVYGESTPLF